jgi:hypothetical protein
MAYEGYLNAPPTAEQISGWVFDDARSDAPLTVEIVCDGKVVASVVADGYRPDLEAANKGNGRHAFAFHRPPGQASSVLSARVTGKSWFIPNGGPQPLEVSPRFLRNLSHPLEFGWPAAEGGFTKPGDAKAAQPVAERLLIAYRRAVADDPDAARSPENDVWSQLGDTCHGPLIAMVRKGDVAGLARYLCDAHAHGITHGITQGHVVTPLLRSRSEVQRVERTRYCDYLASLAECLGVLDVEAPEQHGRWAENIHEPPDRMLQLIADHLGVPVGPPQVIGSLFGLRTRFGIVSARDLLAIYAATRLKALAANLELERASVCEIGTGLGGTAYYCHLLGLGRYAAIDLPIMNMLQGFYLIRALPRADVRLYGESGAAGADIVVLPPWAFGTPDSAADLLFNSDSFPEMHRRYSVAYLKRAPSVIRRGLLSINQESRGPQHGAETQPSVRDLVAEAGGYRQGTRTRNWLRPDYVDEYFGIRRPVTTSADPGTSAGATAGSPVPGPLPQPRVGGRQDVGREVGERADPHGPGRAVRPDVGHPHGRLVQCRPQRSRPGRQLGDNGIRGWHHGVPGRVRLPAEQVGQHQRAVAVVEHERHRLPIAHQDDLGLNPGEVAPGPTVHLYVP